ncbi:hypothetical protein FLP30_00840 [Acetobacter vaccinii]|uniref:DUF4412 domain-containing protein n=2 Tax=Acetobacter vaccinii TaxID=2592655 RepID=A0A5C1YS15_9PROT|nr:hypothetical protein FLP30_00840 [Acetobacter vaccinii]
MLGLRIIARGRWVALGVLGLLGGQGVAQAEDTAQMTAPYVTPSTDVDIHYELSSPAGDATAHQRMRWQVATLRQRLDPENSPVFMLTSWKDRTLTVVDEARHRESVMPVPGGRELTLPGQHPGTGSYTRLGASTVAGQACTIWRTSDTEGRPSDACYTDDGLLLQVAQQGQVTVRALSVQRTPQPDSIFAVPEGLRQENPAHP